MQEEVVEEEEESEVMYEDVLSLTILAPMVCHFMDKKSSPSPSVPCPPQ